MGRDWQNDLEQWLGALEPPFAFLLALPALIALAGLARLHYDGRRSDS